MTGRLVGPDDPFMTGNVDSDTTSLAPGVHFGQLQSVHQVGALIVVESHYGPLLRTPFHRHETSSFTMVFGGGYSEEFTGQKFECETGGALYRPAGEVHRDHISADGACCLMIEMPKTWLERMAIRGLSVRGPSQISDCRGLAMRLRNELVLWDELSGLAIEAMVTELACQMQRAAVRPERVPQWLLRLRDRIEEEFAHLPPLAEMARKLDVHPGHMSRAFRRQFGCTIGEYARRRKIVYCCEQLCRYQASLCDIASSAGFSSQAHMSRVFRLETALTPAQFRRLHRRM